MAGTKKTQKRQLSELVKRLRGKDSQADFAAKLGVKQNVISRWEDSDSPVLPAAQNYARLGSIAPDYADKKWCWEQLGIDMQSLDKFADMRMAERSAQPSEFVEIRHIDPRIEVTIPYASRLLGHLSSVRFTYADFSESPIEPGDIVLIDTTVNNPADAEEGDFLAVGEYSRFGGVLGGIHNIHIGALKKQDVGTSGVQFVLETKGRGGIVFASQDSGGEVKLKLHAPLLGKVLGWTINLRHGGDRHAHRKAVAELKRLYQKATEKK